MCGIAGIVDLTESGRSRSAVKAMVDHLGHRGPDGDAIISFESERVILGHTRLAIIDLTPSGSQPMLSESGELCLTYNGECYNYLELRQELKDESREWQSESDTEVVLRSYEHWGIAAFRKLRGMFALALWDVNRKQLVLARDPYGIKPLYYYQTENSIIFASELTSLLASGLVSRQIDPAGLSSYLENGSVASPNTIIKGVRLLSPGHCLITEQRPTGDLVINEVSYAEEFSEELPKAKVSDRHEAVEVLREALETSVRLHLVSDVPLGLFLSGGMDSSALVALVSQVTDQRPKTFSVVFAEEEFSEAVYARQIAKKFETEHLEIHLGEQQLVDMLPAAISAADQPTMDGINTFVVSKAVKESGITVALSGLGSDELFAGYPTFRRALRLRSLTRLPRPIRQGLSSLGRQVWNRSVPQRKLWQLLASDGTPSSAYSVSRQLFPPDEIEALLTIISTLLYSSSPNGNDPPKPPDEDPINAMSLYELRGYMANTLLRDTDCMSMAHSLEVRVPFVDVEVIRLVLGFPGAWKMNGGRQKPLLQDALGDLLPPEVIHRPKMGFTLPFEKWMQSRLREDIESTFADDARFLSIGLQPEAVRKTWKQFLNKPSASGWSRPWALYVLSEWCAQHEVTL